MTWGRRAIAAASVLVVVLIITILTVWLSARNALGQRPSGPRLERAMGSPQWRDGRFENSLPRIDQGLAKAGMEFLFGSSPHRVPKGPLPIERRTRSDFDTPLPLRVTWLGHSTMLLEIDGVRALIDPVWGERASPLAWAGPKRFYAPPLALEDLPEIDAVVISHDHFDHLDYPTVIRMAAIDTQWLVPLGVGSHLEAWGVPAKRIRELDWWEEHTLGAVRFVCTPARHFSGRAPGEQNSTLWAGWAFVGPEHRAFYSGDTALHPALRSVGERLGPFDITMIETGAYNQAWADVHLGPEQAVLAHQLVQGKMMLPVHWGLFDLALHGWTEPVERVIQAARRLGVSVAVPRPGGSVVPSRSAFVDRFWPELPWDTVEASPAWSTSVVELQAPLR